MILDCKMKLLAFLTIAGITLTTSNSIPTDSNSDEFIDYINSLNPPWKAGRNFHRDTPDEYIRQLMGTVLDSPRDVLPIKTWEDSWDDADLPDEFDSRTAWPNCPTIGEISDQSNCGSCWAISAVEVMSDRICIHSGGNTIVRLSAENLLSCCKTFSHGCTDGFPYEAWHYYEQQGIVTGGSYNSNEGCQPYSMIPCEHTNATKPRINCLGLHYTTPECSHECREGYESTYTDDKYYAKSIYLVERNEQAIKHEIMRNGPVQAGFTVYSDLGNYQSGVYLHTTGVPVGGHAAKIIGWGEEDGLPYWLIANSWNTDWGKLNGYFKILRGVNECGIEEMVLAGIPKYP